MNIAINGFGRIGRIILKIALEKRMKVVAINDVHGAEYAAYLLKYDSIYGKYKRNVSFSGEFLIVNGKNTAPPHCIKFGITESQARRGHKTAELPFLGVYECINVNSCIKYCLLGNFCKILRTKRFC